MPIFEYQCKKCETITEVLQKANDPKPPCESCGSKSTFKVMSNTSFILKGGGWYVTDYARKETKAKDSSSSSDASTDSASKESSSTESSSESSSEKSAGDKSTSTKDKKTTKSAS